MTCTKLRSFCLGGMLSLAALATAQAQTNFFWTNSLGSTFKWSQAANWTNGTIPSASGSNDYTISIFRAPPAISSNDFGTFVLNSVFIMQNSSHTISGGDLVFVSNSSGGAPSIVVNPGGSSPSYRINNNLILSNNTLVGGPGTTLNANLTLAGAISGPGTLLKTNLTPLVLLNGGNSFPSVTVEKGILQLGNSATVATNALGVAVVTNNARVTFAASSGSAYYTNLFTGTGSLLVSNTIAVYLSGSNDYSGGTYFSGGSGRIAAGNDSAFGSGPLYFLLATSSTLSSTGGSARTIANSLVFSNNATLGHGTDNGLLTLTGDANLAGGVRALTISSPVILSGVLSNGGFSKLGSGMLTLSGNNVYAGGTAISNGTLSVSSDANLGATSGAITFGGGTLQVTGTSLTNLNARNVNWSTFNGNFDIADAANTFRVESNITAVGTLTKYGNGKLLLTGSNSLGALFASAGVLELAGSRTTGNGSQPINVGNVAGASASLVIREGTTFLADTGALFVANVANSTGSVIVTGGSLLMTNMTAGNTTFYNKIGGTSGSYGAMVVSGGVVRLVAASGSVARLMVGNNASSAVSARGEIIVAGGDLDLGTETWVGSGGGTGTVLVTAGHLTSTNSGGTLSDFSLGKVAGGGQAMMVISNTGVGVFHRLYVGGSYATGLCLVAEGGLLEIQRGGILQLGFTTGSGFGTLTNMSGGTLRFTGTNTAPFGTVSTSSGWVINAAIEYKDTDAANLAASTLNKLNFEGENTLRLNSATNAAIAYAFTNGGRFSALELVGDNPMWAGSALLIGNGGTLRASNTLATVGSVLTNAGTVSVINGQLTYLSNVVLNGGVFLTQGGTNNFTRGLGMAEGATLTFTSGSSYVSGTITNSGTINAVNANVTYGGPVVISGGYISDPSTNTFATNVTVTASGFLQGGAGDLFQFERDLTLQSTNSTQFNLTSAGVLFTNGSGAHLFDLTGSSALDVGSNFNGIASVTNNFAIGTLTLAVGDALHLSGASSNALYVGALDIGGLANTNQLTLGVNLYYDVTLAANLWLGSNTFVLGSGALIPYPGFSAIPEPGALVGLLVGGGLLLLHIRRRSS